MLKKTQTSDQWNYYQAKSNKGHLMAAGLRSSLAVVLLVSAVTTKLTLLENCVPVLRATQ